MEPFGRVSAGSQTHAEQENRSRWCELSPQLNGERQRLVQEPEIKECTWRGSNSQPLDPKSSALSIELQVRGRNYSRFEERLWLQEFVKMGS
jgi:hypothetical protein